MLSPQSPPQCLALLYGGIGIRVEMANLRRVVVGLKRHDNSETVIPAKFLECIVNFFLPHELCAKVSFELRDDMLVLSPANLKNPERYSDNFPPKFNLSSVVLQHSPDCPVLRLSDDEASQLPEKVKNQGVYVAVSVILESADNKILLTQRADHMRAFPRVWVPPGGNLECGETLSECALRELEEETGLKFDHEASQLQFLCCWESVFPVLLGFGVPRSHHVVAYFHLQSQETWQELQNKIKDSKTVILRVMWYLLHTQKQTWDPSQLDQVFWKTGQKSELGWRSSTNTSYTVQASANIISYFKKIDEPLPLHSLLLNCRFGFSSEDLSVIYYPLYPLKPLLQLCYYPNILHDRSGAVYLYFSLQLDPEEVQACAWLDEQNVENLFGNVSDKKTTTKFSVEHEGNMKSSELDLSSMFHPSLWQQKKIYSGIQLALHHWLLLSKNRRLAMLSKM